MFSSFQEEKIKPARQGQEHLRTHQNVHKVSNNRLIRHPIAKNSFQNEAVVTFWEIYLQDLQEFKLETENRAIEEQ